MSEIVDLLTALTQIPAPSHKEGKRAEYIRKWLENAGVEAHMDTAGNVIVECGIEDREDICIYMAHMDTVFSDENITVVRDNNILRAPGIGDDTANVAMLMMCLKEYALGRLPLSMPCVIAFDTCEEGLGNLKGVRQIMQDYKGRIKEVISFDTTYHAVYNKTVGSRRYQVTVQTKGGHSYWDFGSENAIVKASRLIECLYRIEVPCEHRTTYNVGMIQGGTSVNTIPQEAVFLYEIRSEDSVCLREVEKQFTALAKEYHVAYELIGDRPCMSDVDSRHLEELTVQCEDIIEQVTKQRPRRMSGSTDCNIPASQGITALCFGAYDGGGMHTHEEWVDENSLDKGIEIISKVISRQTKNGNDSL